MAGHAFPELLRRDDDCRCPRKMPGANQFWALGFLGFWVWAFGFRVYGLGFGLLGFGLLVGGSDCLR